MRERASCHLQSVHSDILGKIVLRRRYNIYFYGALMHIIPKLTVTLSYLEHCNNERNN